MGRRAGRGWKPTTQYPGRVERVIREDCSPRPIRLSPAPTRLPSVTDPGFASFILVPSSGRSRRRVLGAARRDFRPDDDIYSTNVPKCSRQAAAGGGARQTPHPEKDRSGADRRLIPHDSPGLGGKLPPTPRKSQSENDSSRFASEERKISSAN